MAVNATAHGVCPLPLTTGITMDLICPNCQKRLTIEDRSAGTVVKCPLCGGTMTCPPDQKKTAGTVCRAASNACDLAETCDGATPSCPP